MDSKFANGVRGTLAWMIAMVGVVYLALFAGRPSGTGLPTAAATALPEEDMVLFDEGLGGGWQDWSWAERSYPDPALKMGSRPSIRLTPAQWKGLYFHHDAFQTNGYKTLSFFVHGGVHGGQKLNVMAVGPDNKFLPGVTVASFIVGGSIPAGRFELCVIPLEKLQAANARIAGILFQDGSGGQQEPLNLANIRITAPVQPPKPIVLNVDTTRIAGEISPYIYGMAQVGPEYYKALRLKMWRWGGNPNTRYNWEKGNHWNAARDWGFRNGNYSHNTPEDRLPSGFFDKVQAEAKAAGCDAYVTVPTMGWVARDDSNATASEGVPNETGPPVAPGAEAIAGYDPTANRKKVSVRSLPRKGKPFSDPPDLNDEVVYQDEWISHLTRKFGKASAGGVRFYAIDNEPDLWDVTHTDMHPVRPDYEEILKQFLDASTAIKDVDPTAQIGGPVSWGWTGYFYSPRDRGDDRYKTAADRKAHGDMPFVPWFLQQVAAFDKKAGRRTLDVLDVHFYPQMYGVYQGNLTDEKTNALRLRSTRALWDPGYADESWIGTAVQLIPRLRQWVDKYYPGTKIGLMEWNWGGDSTLNGGLTIGEILGVFGRERLDMACYWAIPAVNSPGFLAWKMYRNADDKGGGFGDRTVFAESNVPDKVSCFGSADSKTSAPAIMLINKMPQQSARVTLNVKSARPATAFRLFRYSGADLKNIVQLADVSVSQGRLQIELPAYSMTLLRGK